MRSRNDARRWPRLLTRGGRHFLLGQHPAGGQPWHEPCGTLAHLPVVGLVVGYRIRQGVGDDVTDWVEQRLALRGRRLVPAESALEAIPPSGPAGPVAILLVLPLGPGVMPEPHWPSSLGPGCAVGLVGYGPPRGDLDCLYRRREQILERGAEVAEEMVVIDADEFRERKTPTPFERLAVDALLDHLAPS